ncbi:MAG: hypothetical protein CFE21_02870 [Bacteroidetes bacterium B1(2017)]|nr:MAG: hypothetical protein CFE21_02870 [Bacteroidetes bacterium B1(2017)]
MKSFLLIIWAFISSSLLLAQETTPFKKGLVFGVSVGAGNLRLNTNDTLSNAFSTSLPNIKIGYMPSSKLAIMLLLPGAVYKYQEKDRGFEAFMVAGQYCLKEKWWVLGAAGICFDAAAFYTVKDPKTSNFYTGFPALSVGTGYQIYHKRKFSMDIQYRFFYGQSNIENAGKRQGTSNMILLGFNWH